MRFIVGLLYIFLLALSAKENLNYAVIVDAGSSGSRLHLYSYSDANISSIEEKCIFKVKPGLSSYANAPHQAVSSANWLSQQFKACLAKENITPTEKIEFHIFATAGMRLLDTNTSAKIYDVVKKTLDKEPNIKVVSIETIDGKQEGLYDWLAVNALMGTFNDCAKPSYGAIDVGGASAQIAYVVDDKEQSNITQNVADCSYSLYVKSYLGLGRNQARNAVERLPNAKACRNADFNYSKCQDAYSTLLNDFSVPSNMKKAADNKGFVAMDTAANVAKFLKQGNELSSQNMSLAIKNICAKSLGELKTDYPKIPDIEHFCSASVLIQTLLYDKAGFDLKNTPVTATNKIGNKEPEWSLGAMIYIIEKKRHATNK